MTPRRERRASPRASVRLVVQFQTSAGRETGESLDLSAGGMLLHSPVDVPVGTTLSLKFHPPTWSRPALISGTVVRSVGRGAKLGIRFDHANADSEFELAQFVQRQLERMLGLADLPPQRAPPRTPGTARVEAPAPESLRASLSTTDAFASEYAKNLSRGRLWVETAVARELGSLVEVLIELPHPSAPVLVRGRVVARNPASSSRPGLHVELVEEPALVALHELARLLRRDSVQRP